MSSLTGKNILVIGARAGGYGETLAKACIRAGARVFGTTLNPDDEREKNFFDGLGAVLLDVPLVYDSAQAERLPEQLSQIEKRLRDLGVTRLHALLHTVAGGFPRHPSVMKSVGDILKGKNKFSDMATLVKRNVYYVNATSFYETVRGLPNLVNEQTHLLALTYRGDLPYFIAPSKQYLERLALRLADHGKRTLIAALPEAWTQSSQFFTGIEIAVLHNYLKHLKGRTDIDGELSQAFSSMEESLTQVKGFEPLVEELQVFLSTTWSRIGPEIDQAELFSTVDNLLKQLRKSGKMSSLRRGVEIISEFVREACGLIVMREFLEREKYNSGDVRQVFYKDLLGFNEIGTVEHVKCKPKTPSYVRKWVEYGRDEIRSTLSMYGENFLFPQRIIMEDGGFAEGKLGFCTIVVPSPEENIIMRDHFVGLPLFGGHLQMEAVGQFGTFVILKSLKDQKMLPILTGTEFPDLNTMAPPGEKLTIMGELFVPDRRLLAFHASIENRFARSEGLIKGMLVTDRVLKKMLSSFFPNNAQD